MKNEWLKNDSKYFVTWWGFKINHKSLKVRKWFDSFFNFSYFIIQHSVYICFLIQDIKTVERGNRTHDPHIYIPMLFQIS